MLIIYRRSLHYTTKLLREDVIDFRRIVAFRKYNVREAALGHGHTFCMRDRGSHRHRRITSGLNRQNW